MKLARVIGESAAWRHFMRSAILAVVLIAAAGAAVMAAASNHGREEGRFPLIGQGLEGVPADLPRTAAELNLAIRDHGALPVSFGASGQRFTCAQIRVMDEVELITDDSYCE